jgi:hypothetical protein
LFASSALASEPATVTVRVVGANNQTLVPLTQVTTTTAPVDKDGVHTCVGTSAAGALELATAGNWAGKWFEGESAGYFVETIGGVGFSTSYWNFWHNNEESKLGICAAELSTGDSILFFPECFEMCSGSAPNVLGIQAPATVEVGKPVLVTVLSYPNAGGSPTPLANATVVGGGDSSALPTNEQGQTTMTFSGDGKYVLHATASGEGPPAIPGEVFVCAHEGNDGTCGTTLPGSAPVTPASSNVVSAAIPYKGPFALVARATGVLEGHVYRRGHAPRVLAGGVLAHTALTSVSISLRRSYRGHCYAYNAIRERLQRAACGKDSFFRVATKGLGFSYLLPAQLPSGRYVLDMEATDAAGNHTALARGSSRFVFYVR